MQKRAKSLKIAAVSQLALGAVLAFTPMAMAQETQDASVSEPLRISNDAPDTESIQQKVTVTGSRIQRANIVSNSPMTTVGQEEIKLSGTVNIENTLNQLPQFTPDANENVSNGSDGTAQVNLRDLGSSRNLVLINGQRMLPDQATNINFVPSFMVERVDVVTGGASAVYGSDAMSGVVNFILRDNLDGIIVDGQFSQAFHTNDYNYIRDIISSQGYENAKKNVSDGAKFDINFAIGSDFKDGRGNITGYVGYRKTDPILQADRDVSACALNQAQANTTFSCGGSGNNQYGVFIPQGGPNSGTQFVNTKDGQKTWGLYDSSYLYNYAPLNYFQRADERWTYGGFFHYDVHEKAEIYGSAMVMDDQSISQVAPSALWWGSNFTTNCDNPFLSDDIGSKLCGADYGTATEIPLFVGYRPVASPAKGRVGDIHHFDYRLSGGVRGEIVQDITYDLNVLTSSTTYDFLYSNDIYQDRANRALSVVDVNGTPTCTSVIDGSDKNCIAADFFGYGNLSAEALDYLYGTTFTNNKASQTVLSGVISSDLTRFGAVSPWAENGIGLVAGAEYRKDSFKSRNDASLLAAGVTDTQGDFNVLELFGEIEIPVLQDRPFAKSLTLNAGFRTSDYSTLDKAVNTYKAEIEWAPASDVRFRSSFNHAIRAPNISELFASQTLGNVGGAFDPCAGANPTASFAICALTGVSQAQYGNIADCPADTCVTRGGGNPDLKPEEADTYTFGFVLTPTAIPGLTLTADYYDIKIEDYISSVSASVVISQCVTQASPYFCGLFNRAPGSGIIFGDGFISAGLQNSGSLATSGYDFSGTYALPTKSFGNFNFSLVGTLLDKWEKVELPGLDSYDCAGLFGPSCGQPAPKWRHNARLTWDDPTGTGSLSLAWRHIGSTELTLNQDDPFLSGTKHVVNAKLPAYDYFDLVGTLPVGDHFVFRAGINNLLDKNPPAIASGLLAEFGNGNTYPGVYNVVGRLAFIGITAEF